MPNPIWGTMALLALLFGGLAIADGAVLWGFLILLTSTFYFWMMFEDSI